MADAAARPTRVTVHKTHRTILEAAWPKTVQVDAVAERGRWMAVATSSTEGEWSIRVCDLAPTRPCQIADAVAEPHTFSTLAVGTVGSPAWVDISSDGVLVAALRNGGVRLFVLALHAQLGVACAYPCLNFQSAFYAKFIAPAADEASVIVATTDTTTHTVALYKSPLSSRSSVQPLLKAPLSDITDVQASEPGRVVVLSRKNHCMYLLTMNEERLFCMRTLPLSQFEGRRAGVPACTPTTVAVGDQLVVVGYCCAEPGPYGVCGLVEAFSLETGGMVARRSMRASHPAAMRTHGPRIVVGGASTGGCGAGADTLYIFGVHDACNHAVANLATGESWSSARLHITARSWAYTQRLVGASVRDGASVVWETVHASLSDADRD